jgi:hypothetical protein
MSATATATPLSADSKFQTRGELDDFIETRTRQAIDKALRRGRWGGTRSAIRS